jgi:hypothetical protein
MSKHPTRRNEGRTKGCVKPAVVGCVKSAQTHLSQPEISERAGSVRPRGGPLDAPYNSYTSAANNRACSRRAKRSVMPAR